MDELKKEIAKIKSTALGYEDHGVFTAMLDLDYGGSGQGAGGYSLDTPNGKHRMGTAYGCEFIIRLIRACGVRKWEDIAGRTVYALIDEERRLVVGIENLPTERGERFLFEEIKEMAPA